MDNILIKPRIPTVSGNPYRPNRAEGRESDAGREDTIDISPQGHTLLQGGAPGAAVFGWAGSGLPGFTSQDPALIDATRMVARHPAGAKILDYLRDKNVEIKWTNDPNVPNAHSKVSPKGNAIIFVNDFHKQLDPRLLSQTIAHELAHVYIGFKHYGGTADQTVFEHTVAEDLAQQFGDIVGVTRDMVVDMNDRFPQSDSLGMYDAWHDGRSFTDKLEYMIGRYKKYPMDVENETLNRRMWPLP